ncbi:MAG TPA: DUF1800 domain-containing protein [Verrucomicrobiae bacterium]|jgi:uncharacterized protein (DUF1800 family)|nr:DUF1800 domain-containing protein [Verrucomicrobiae bacterium]
MLKALPGKQWDYEMAAHLLNRAGFGGTPAEIERLAKLGHDGAVAHLVDFEKVPDYGVNPDWAKPDPERAERLRKAREADPEVRRQMQQEEQKMDRQRTVELRYWWLERMAYGSRPLQEKMTLFWHGHFATSIEKVRDPYLMWRQNDLFRQQGTGYWYDLLLAVAKDPAMLVWLDQAQSRKEHPNENFAREVMELFTLGEGHYTEHDVTESARALTGWTYNRLDQEFDERPRLHDYGTKSFLGQTGSFTGEDILRIIVEQPQASRFITAKLWNFFAGEPPSEEINASLAEIFRNSGNQFKPVLKAMFRCEAFYSPSVVRNQVKSPVQWLVGSVRMLERPLPGPFICAGLTKNLGQDLFAPPNVKGWDGGLSWITTNNLLARYNEAAILVQGDMNMLRTTLAGVFPGSIAASNMAQNRRPNFRLEQVDVERILAPEERTDKSKLVAALEKRLLQSKLSKKQEATLRDYLDSQTALNDEAILNAVRLMMSTPEYQLA